MNSSDRTRGDPLATTGETAALAAAVEDHGSWLQRMKLARTRHAAITRNLNTFANYKYWADQVKGAWVQEPEPKRK